jgi:hypothetical protein
MTHTFTSLVESGGPMNSRLIRGAPDHRSPREDSAT